MLKSLSADRKFQLYLSVLAVIGLIFILVTTSKYGAGVSSDAGRNLSTADNLLAGKGFVDMSGAAFVLWPPLYPLVMAGLSLLTGWSTFRVAWYLNVFLYALNLWLMGWLLYLIFKDKPYYAVIGALVLTLSRSTLRLYANVASEPLFVSFMLIFFFAAGKYLNTTSRSALWWMFIMAGLATAQRYLGVVLIGTAGLVVLFRERWTGIWRAAFPILASILPIAAWALLHNYPIDGTFFGPRNLGKMFPLQNISLSLTKIIWWFIPRLSFLDPLILNPWMILAPLFIFLLIINRKTNWQAWLRRLSDVYVWPSLLFSTVYFFLLAFTVVTADHLDLTSDRYYMIILPVVLVVLFFTFDALILPHLKWNSRITSFVLIGVVLLWFAYPIYSMQEYLRTALVQGEPTNYNIANSAHFREMSVVKAAEPILAKDPSALVYSNYLNIVWFIFGHPVKMLPAEDFHLSHDQKVAALKQDYPDWPRESGYLIWFIPNEYHYIVAPNELQAVTNMKLLYKDKTGEIYYIRAKSP